MSEHLQSANNVYRVVKGVIRRPRDPQSNRQFSTTADFIKQDEIIPDGFLSPAEIESLLAGGRIEAVTTRPGEKVPGPPARRGKWGVDPVGLIGKSLEDMHVMILEIDPDFAIDKIQTQEDAVVQLTADWDPAFREVLSKSTDRSRPEQLGHSGIKDLGDKPMSDTAKAALDRAKAKAQPQG